MGRGDAVDRETADLARMVHTRIRRVYRELDELRRLSARLLQQAEKEDTPDGDTAQERKSRAA